MSTFSERMVEANRLSHHVMEWGEPKARAGTIVLAHGWADAGASFDATAQVLAGRGFFVVAFDWRGFGRTERVGRGGYYHFPDYVLDLTELTRALDLGPYALVGHSMGGTASAMFAGTGPAGLRALVLAEGLGPPASSDGYARRLREWIDGVQKTNEKPPTKMADLSEATRRLRVQHPDLDDALAARIVPHLVTPHEGGFLFAFDPLHKTRAPYPFRLDLFEDALVGIAVPTLVVLGEAGYRNADHAERVAKIRDVREVLLPGVGHMMHWHAPEAFAAAIADFAGPLLLQGASS